MILSSMSNEREREIEREREYLVELLGLSVGDG